MVTKYKDLEVYQRAYKLALEVHKITLDFPKIEQYALANQLRRSSKSVCVNIAEGFAKSHKSSAEFKRFLLMSLGSAEESNVWLEFAKDLNYIAPEIHQRHTDDYKIVCKQLNTLISKWKD